MSSTYCTRSDLESRWGPENILDWADIDNEGLDDADITTQINTAIAYAGDIIDSYGEHTSFRIPFVQSDGSSTPGLIKDTAVALAGAYLFDHRGFPADHQQYEVHRAQAYKTLQEIRDGVLSVPGAERGFS